MRLALQLGCPNVDAMLREMSAEQFAEWCAFFTLEPWGFHEENRRMSVIAATIANYSGKVLRDGVVVSPSDFMPEERPKPNLLAKLKAIFGGR